MNPVCGGAHDFGAEDPECCTSQLFASQEPPADEWRAHAGKTVIIVTHGGFLSLLYKAIMQHAKASGVIRNCAICEVLSDGRTLAALSWNRAAPGEEEGGKDAFGGGLYG